MKYTKENPLRVFEICAGYGSQGLALNRLKQQYPDFDYELVGWCEFDPESKAPIDKQPAVVAHNALHPDGTGNNYGDLTKIDWSQVPDFDLLTASTPCQSISAAGLMHGFAKGSGTRSSLIWCVVECASIKKPKYIVNENVANILSGKFMPEFKAWLRELNSIGYENVLPPQFPTPWKGKGAHTKLYTINACDMGVPQNRVRMFCVSILRTPEDPNPKYYFPKPFHLTKKLKDVLEEHVDEKYYLSDKMLEYFQSVNDEPDTGGVQLIGKVNSSQDGEIVNKNGLSPCHTAGHGNCPKILDE